MELLSSRDPVVVAMSGGVDSCAAALMLTEEGHSVIGISMQVWDYRKNGGNAKRATCCAPSDFDDARQVAEGYGFPYYVFDFEDSFYDSVIRPFVESYQSGKTPNPCLDCNRKVKFRELRRRAAALGASVVATGHYAQIKRKNDGTLGLYTSRDERKDQSYFLYAMTQHDLENTRFPVGSMTKDEVREYLGERGFAVADKAESQDICFVSSTASEFVEKESDTELPHGEVVNTSGEVLGTHVGIHRFTVGQRRGVGVSSEHPLYVLNINSETNRVTVGEKDELASEKFFVEDVNWISGVQPTKPITALVKLRYRHQGVLCEIEPLPNDDNAQGLRAKLSFADNWSAVSPGQAAVFYQTETDQFGDREVLGGGIISQQ